MGVEVGVGVGVGELVGVGLAVDVGKTVMVGGGSAAGIISRVDILAIAVVDVPVGSGVLVATLVVAEKDWAVDALWQDDNNCTMPSKATMSKMEYRLDFNTRHFSP